MDDCSNGLHALYYRAAWRVGRPIYNVHSKTHYDRFKCLCYLAGIFECAGALVARNSAPFGLGALGAELLHRRRNQTVAAAAISSSDG